jgi:hypothetical protein
MSVNCEITEQVFHSRRPFRINIGTGIDISARKYKNRFYNMTQNKLEKQATDNIKIIKNNEN